MCGEFSEGIELNESEPTSEGALMLASTEYPLLSFTRNSLSTAFHFAIIDRPELIMYVRAKWWNKIDCRKSTGSNGNIDARLGFQCSQWPMLIVKHEDI